MSFLRTSAIIIYVWLFACSGFADLDVDQIILPKIDQKAGEQLGYCSMQPGRGVDPPIVSYHYPTYPMPTLETRTCEILFGNLSCCSRVQTEAFKISPEYNEARSSLSSCPACFFNVLTMWCGWLCSPWQANFVTATSWNRNTSVISSSDYTMHEEFTDRVYQSCQSVHLNNKTVSNIYPTPQAFVNWVMGMKTSVKVNPIITNNVTERAFNFTTAPCNASCDCSQCPSSCHFSPNMDLDLSNTHPTIEMFNSDWSYFKLGLAISYLALIVIFFTAVTIWLALYKSEPLKKNLPLVGVLLAVILAVLGTGLGISVAIKSECGVTMFNGRWSCATLGFAIAMVSVVLCFPIALSLVTYWILFRTRTRSVISEAGSGIRMTWQEIAMDPSARQKGWLQKYFLWHGALCASHPKKIIILSLLVTAALSAGMFNLEQENDLNKMWISASSQALANQQTFNNYFGSFYRREQVIITYEDPTRDILKTNEVMIVLFYLEQLIGDMSVKSDDQVVSLKNLCYKPIPDKGCQVLSPFEYWQRSVSRLDSTPPWKHISFCSQNPRHESCLTQLGLQLDPDLVLGGFTKSNFEDTKAVIVTWELTDYPYNLKATESWEKLFVEMVRDFKRDFPNFNFVYNTESSMKNELALERPAVLPSIIGSYCVMLVYIALALGTLFPIRSTKYLLIDTKFTLGLGVMIMVAGSLTTSMGLCGMFGLKNTLEVALVLPFLILALGIDNVFVLVDAFEQTNTSFDVQERVAEALSQVGSSMALASLSEGLAFLLGLIVDIPAVRTFSTFAGVAILYNFLLQISFLISCLALDAQRQKDNRLDLFACYKIKEWDPAPQDKLLPMLGRKRSKALLRSFAQRYLAPFVLHPFIKIVLLFGFVGMFMIGLLFCTEVDVGLEQQDFLPTSSYVLDFIKARNEYALVGPPLYFVLTNMNFSDPFRQNQVCNLPGCQWNSLMSYAKASPVIHTNNQSTDWVDAYLLWSQSPSCCRDNLKSGRRCSSNSSDLICQECMSMTSANRPPNSEFSEFLIWFLNSRMDENCPVIGNQFASDVMVSRDTMEISASRIQFYHEPLSNSKIQLEALKTAYTIVEKTGISGFAFSNFYLFTEEYLYVRTETWEQIGICLGAVFLMTIILLGNPGIAIAVVGVVGMILVDVLAGMYLFGLELNGISMVNILLAMGMSIEFCVHTAHAFSRSVGTKNQRSYRAMVEMTSPVVSGVLMTKIVGLTVLSFSQSIFIREYYFGMYCIILVMALLHGVFFLPVVLSLMGTDKYALSLPQKFQYPIEIDKRLVEPL